MNVNGLDHDHDHDHDHEQFTTNPYLDYLNKNVQIDLENKNNQQNYQHSNSTAGTSAAASASKLSEQIQIETGTCIKYQTHINHIPNNTTNTPNLSSPQARSPYVPETELTTMKSTQIDPEYVHEISDHVIDTHSDNSSLPKKTRKSKKYSTSITNKKINKKFKKNSKIHSVSKNDSSDSSESESDSSSIDSDDSIDSEDEIDAKPLPYKTELGIRMLVCLLAIALVWCTSLNLAGGNKIIAYSFVVLKSILNNNIDFVFCSVSRICTTLCKSTFI
jgi:hypothetical protein